MDYQYKVIVRNRSVYKEFEISPEMERVKLGTSSACEFRLNPEIFFAEIEIEFHENNQAWSIDCGDSVYISRGDMRKLFSAELKHGDVINVCYAATGNPAFELRFMIDFEAKVPNFNWYVDLDRPLTLSTDMGADLILMSQFGDHCRAVIRPSGSSFLVEPGVSAYGLLLNAQEIKSPKLLTDCDFISIGEFQFYYKENKLYFDHEHIQVASGTEHEVMPQVNSFDYPLFNRNTRIKKKTDEEEIEILLPPTMIKAPKENIALAIVPMLVMLCVTVVIRGFLSNNGNSTFVWISAISMSMGIITSVIGIINARKEYKEDVKERVEKYGQYIEKKKEFIANARQEELDYMRETYINIDEDLALMEQFDSNLFERSLADEDFLQVYLGTGRVKAKRPVTCKHQETYEIEDELFDIPDELCAQFKYIDHAPITADFKNSNAIGIIGSDENNKSMLNNIIIDLTARHYYLDLQLFAFISEEDVADYDWIRLLPHFSINQKLRNIVCDNDSKNNIFELLYKELSLRKEQASEEGNAFTPLVILVKDEMGIKNHPIAQFIPEARLLNVTFVFFENYRESLPMACDQVIALQNESQGLILNAEDGNERNSFEYHAISRDQIEKFASKLAPIYCEEISLESSLRKSITMFELLNIYNVDDLDIDERWSSSAIYKTMAAPLGVNAKNELVNLDLHEKFHGPHGLVAGTTGSGKSEILQSYILSAATLFHPYEIGFVIIDFKGGGMVNQFKNLPHLIGAITNIDGKEINRSLKSIKAELLKRQTLFAQAEVNHIDKYIKLYKDGKVNVALPHLVIIVDEFAELKAEQPEFMKELISAARIGRSLGVHLILATQKPAGQVNEQIWSNSKFKLCLKVQTKEDSNEVIKSPLAAEIREPGRAYLQVGNNEIFELFQSGFSGAPAQVEDANVKEFAIHKVEFAGKRKEIFVQKKQKSSDKTETQLDAIVNYLQNHCEMKGIKRLPAICLPSLEKKLNFPAGEKVERSIDMLVPIGVYDNPDAQYQGQAMISAAAENMMIIGSAQYGKTNFLQTIIRGLVENYTPNEVNIYILDFGAMLLKNYEGLHHVGGVVTASEDEKFKNLFKLLYKEVEKRKEILLKAGVSSFSSYREAGFTDLPQIVLMVDNFTALKELYLADEDMLLPLCRDGIAVGLSVIIANAQTSGFGYKYFSSFARRIALYCNDSGEYNSILDRCREQPDNTPGRGLLEIEKEIYEFQTYLAFEGEREIDRVNNMREFIAAINAKYPSMHARRIPEIPALLDEETYVEMAEIKRDGYVIPIGLNYETIQSVEINLVKQNVLGILGREQSGKSNLLRVIMQQLYAQLFDCPTEVFLYDDYDGGLKEFEDLGIVSKYSIDSSDFVEQVVETAEILAERQKTVAEEGVKALDEMPLLLFVVQSQDAILALSKDANAMKKYKEMLTSFKNMKVSFIFSNLEDATIPYSGPEVLKMFKDNKNFFYFNNIANIKFSEITSTVARKFKKEIGVGDAYYFNGSDIDKVKTVLCRED